MVNSESDFNENSFENAEQNYARLLWAKLISPSMDPLFRVGEKVPVRIKSVGVHYKKGDIIAFNRDGVIVLHQIIDSYMYKGEVYYVTGGMNPDTNPFVDSITISRDAIIGKADLEDLTKSEIYERIKGKMQDKIRAIDTLENAGKINSMKGRDKKLRTID